MHRCREGSAGAPLQAPPSHVRNGADRTDRVFFLETCCEAARNIVSILAERVRKTGDHLLD